MPRCSVAISSRSLPPPWERSRGGIAGPQADAAPDRRQKPSPNPTLAHRRLQHRVPQRASRPRGLSTGRHRRGHDLPGRHRGAVAFSLRNRPEVLNEPARLRPSPSRARRNGPRAGRPRARLETVRHARAAATAAGGTSFGLPRFGKADFRCPLSLRHGATFRPPCPAGGRIDRLEPLRAGRRRLLEPAAGRLGIPFHESDHGDGRGGLLLQRAGISWPPWRPARTPRP